MPTTKRRQKKAFTKKEVDLAVTELCAERKKMKREATPAQKKQLDATEFEITKARDQMIEYHSKGELVIFMRDVCKLNLQQLRLFCQKLSIEVPRGASYDEICAIIPKKRPALFRRTENWDYMRLV